MAGGFGRPGLHTDVGGEFTNTEVIEMAERLGCCVTSTAGDSPYMNGLNEKNHHKVDRMYSMIEEDNPDLKPEEMLAHALDAKNSLQMIHGFSSLGFGQSPNNSGLIDATPPMLEDNIHGDVMRKHFNALYSVRQAYIKSESNSKIKLMTLKAICKDVVKICSKENGFVRKERMRSGKVLIRLQVLMERSW